MLDVKGVVHTINAQTRSGGGGMYDVRVGGGSLISVYSILMMDGWWCSIVCFPENLSVFIMLCCG